jgi:adenosylcobinamide-GDP ribazoletransferase
MHSFLVALAFLTILPIRFRVLPPVQVVARSRYWYPVVGLLMGAVLGGWTALLSRGLAAPPVSAFLILLAWVGVTGALHLDGFCDLCDGLFGGHTPEDRLRILRDPHLGTFGLAGGVLLLLGKFVLLSEILAAQPAQGPWVVGAAVVVARCLVLCVAAGSPYPRPEGTGKTLIEATRWWEAGLFAGAGAAAAVPAAPAWSVYRALVLFAPALLAVAALRGLCRRRLGGITGDCLGAAVEVAEWTFLLAVVLARFERVYTCTR